MCARGTRRGFVGGGGRFPGGKRSWTYNDCSIGRGFRGTNCIYPLPQVGGGWLAHGVARRIDWFGEVGKGERRGNGGDKGRTLMVAMR